METAPHPSFPNLRPSSFRGDRKILHLTASAFQRIFGVFIPKGQSSASLSVKRRFHANPQMLSRRERGAGGCELRAACLGDGIRQERKHAVHLQWAGWRWALQRFTL